ncbi:conserved hypothetical protein [Burkholderia multivorans CGD2M]|uniref:Uncharacterized protein n=1 Tax=Burkholderia multivorans CGD2 TaxID=513052 RepID=B9BKA2_9BURK|nr:conserved hypothetical protein [Burkholderia multivorans CGD2]EEE16056.1 conserved hypothetical protein [Burkholderia multivorans CGD2M]
MLAVRRVARTLVRTAARGAGPLLAAMGVRKSTTRRASGPAANAAVPGRAGPRGCASGAAKPPRPADTDRRRAIVGAPASYRAGRRNKPETRTG